MLTWGPRRYPPLFVRSLKSPSSYNKIDNLFVASTNKHTSLRRSKTYEGPPEKLCFLTILFFFAKIRWFAIQNRPIIKNVFASGVCSVTARKIASCEEVFPHSIFISKLSCESEEFQILPALPHLAGPIVTEREPFWVISKFSCESEEYQIFLTALS